MLIIFVIDKKLRKKPLTTKTEDDQSSAFFNSYVVSIVAAPSAQKLEQIQLPFGGDAKPTQNV